MHCGLIYAITLTHTMKLLTQYTLVKNQPPTELHVPQIIALI